MAPRYTCFTTVIKSFYTHVLSYLLITHVLVPIHLSPEIWKKYLKNNTDPLIGKLSKISQNSEKSFQKLGKISPMKVWHPLRPGCLPPHLTIIASLWSECQNLEVKVQNLEVKVKNLEVARGTKQDMCTTWAKSFSLIFT